MESKPEDVASIVERYRIKLGLKPWEEWAEQINAILLAKGYSNIHHRRTGRTQFGILQAIAMCEIRYAEVLSVRAEPRANLDYCMYMASRSVLGLGLEKQIMITRDFPGCSGGRISVLFTDHHIHIRGRAAS